MSKPTFASSAEATAERFLDSLRRYRDDRGAMAALRCAMSPSRRQRAWPCLGRQAIGDRRYEMVAALYATHPQETAAYGFGELCRRLSAEHNSFEGRFKRLLTCDTGEEAAEHVRPLVQAAKAAGKPVNYAGLLADLLEWERGDGVKVRWAREFWGAPDEEAISPNLIDAAAATDSADATPAASSGEVKA